MVGEKLCSGSLEVYTPVDFQAETLSFYLKSIALHVV